MTTTFFLPSLPLASSLLNQPFSWEVVEVVAGVERREKEEVVLKECTLFDDDMLDRKRAIIAVFMMMCCVCVGYTTTNK